MHGESVQVGLTVCRSGSRGATLRIGTRMTAGFGSIAVLLAITCGLGWILASQQIRSTSSERVALAATRDIKQYQLDAAGVAVAANSIAYDFTSHSNPSADLTSFAQSVSAARVDSSSLSALTFDASERGYLAQASQALDAYISQSEQINAEFVTDSPSSLRAANLGVAALAYHTITAPLEQLEQLSTNQANSALAAASARDSQDRILVVVLILAALALAAGVGMIVTRSITSRLHRTASVLDEIAAGDLTRRIDIESSDEVGQMAGALNVALDRIEVRTRAQVFERRLANALEMAEDETDVLRVIERSFSSMLDDAPSELLLADNSHAHLLRMASASPSGLAPGCSVDSPDHCPAARRAQVQRFSDSEALDACPKLQGRPEGALSALCVPLSIMGRTVGVIHATRGQHRSFADETVRDVEILANLAGARIGMVRVMSETQLQATTDSLTGLLNRRSFEDKASALRRRESLTAVVMADLDHFKLLNDTYGHDTGDRALRLFARVLSESVRGDDLICRQGGEEFVMALPGCSTERVREILGSLTVRLDAAITVAGLPKFTVSFGVVEAGDQEDLPTTIARADTALFQAKQGGRDQVVVHDASGNSVLSRNEQTTSLGLAGENHRGLEIPAEI
jgi:diguanylate cyclase (GGDEF)-like protein